MFVSASSNETNIDCLSCHGTPVPFTQVDPLVMTNKTQPDSLVILYQIIQEKIIDIEKLTYKLIEKENENDQF